MALPKRSDREILLKDAESLGLDLSQSQVVKLLDYARLLREWNLRMNLISRRDIENLVPGHLMDSLAGVPVLKRLFEVDPENKAVSLVGQARGMARDDTAPTRPPKVMDLGSGGGLPGIPLKICLPQIDLTLVESTKKKARFLETAVRELGLKGVTVVDRHSREIEKDACHRGKYDTVTARAVAELKDLVMLAIPFLGPGGRLLAYKGPKAEEEILRARGILRKLGAIIETSENMAWPGLESTKRILIIQFFWL